MILLDTNVISELMVEKPSPRVLDWIDRQNFSELFTCTIIMAELFAGLDAMPQGKRKLELQLKCEYMLKNYFSDRVYTFDKPSAINYGMILNTRKLLGTPINTMDALIAAITLTHHATLVTRNERDFEDCGIQIINPWNFS